MSSSDEEIVASVRQLSGVTSDVGPDDAHILAGVRGFAAAFNFWYIRVMRGAVPKYRNVVVARINPFIRRVEFDGLSAAECSQRLVEDYNRRNFVTAGGWALEELAISASPEAQKSTAEGVDAQRFDPASSEYHLYVLKSGLVTRNSDIIKQIKRSGRQAEKLLKQGRSTGNVHLNYAILAGKTSSSFEDGVRRPSSAEFWGEMFNLQQEDALELALAIAAEAGRLVSRDASKHVQAMECLVTKYVESESSDGEMDWEYVARRNMQSRESWRAEDTRRHQRAMNALMATGYVLGAPDSDDDQETDEQGDVS